MEPEAILASNMAELPGELWKVCVGFPDYAVSSLGRMRGIRGRLLKQSLNTAGYLRVAAYLDTVCHQLALHHAVLEAFVGPRPEGMQAAHLNGVRTDNRLANLLWCTPQENERHKIAHGTRTPEGADNPNAQVCVYGRKLVRSLVLDHGFTVAKVCRMGDMSETTVRRICQARR